MSLPSHSMKFLRRATRIRQDAAGVPVLHRPALEALEDRVLMSVTEFPIPTADSQPVGIARGSDGNLWFAELHGIGRITPAGVVTEFRQSLSATGAPFDITAGPDGNLWFNEGNERLGRITTAGVITEFVIPQAVGGPGISGITAGPDGNIWFTEPVGGIGRFNPTTGVSTVFDTTAAGTRASSPGLITRGPDGNLWWTDSADKIGRITTTGVITLFSAGISPGSDPAGITAGPDGNLWFTEDAGNRIGRITTAGVVTEFTNGITANSNPARIVAGPDGNLWFTEQLNDLIGRITPAGVVTEFASGTTPEAGPAGIAVGSDGNIWFTELGANQIGRLDLTQLGLTAGFKPAQGILTIIGDSLADNIVVSRNAAGTILVNGSAVTAQGITATVANTTLIQISGLAGNDILSLNETNGPLPKASTNGGAGNDSVTGGSGNDSLTGGTGNDTLVGGPGNDVFTGGVDVGASNATINGGPGTDTINALNGSLTVLPSIGDDIVNVSPDNASPAHVVFQGTQRIGALNIGAPGDVRLPSGSNEVLTATALNIAGNGKLNLTNNGLIIDYTGASPIAQVQSLITRGFNGGIWNGTGITTSLGNTGTFALGFAEASQVAPGGTFAGQPVDGTAVLVKFTLQGDSNLDGRVDTLDFNSLAANFGRTGRFWAQGDFNYDGVVDTVDFSRLAAGFGSTTPVTASDLTVQPLHPTAAATLTSGGFSEIRIDTPLARELV